MCLQLLIPPRGSATAHARMGAHGAPNRPTCARYCEAPGQAAFSLLYSRMLVIITRGCIREHAQGTRREKGLLLCVCMGQRGPRALERVVTFPPAELCDGIFSVSPASRVSGVASSWSLQACEWCLRSL